MLNCHKLDSDSKCEIMNTWIPCSNCYSYTQTIQDWDDYYFNYDTFDVIYDEFTCTFSISTKCNPNFVDTFRTGRNCDQLARHCKNGQGGGYTWFLDYGIMTDDGYMTAFNCPQCGCTEENGPIRPNFATLHP